MRVRTLLALLVLNGLLLACEEDDFRLSPSDSSRVDTFTLGGLLTNPDLDVPSGYFIGQGATTVKPWTGTKFDIAFDVDSVQGPALYPAEMTGLIPHSASNPGLKRMSVPFDSITRADLNGYVVDAIAPIEVGDVFLARSEPRCGGGLSMYAKLEILAVDSAASTMTFRVLRNANCQYRDLKVGYPEN